jgi:hypothetical protein
MAGFEVTTEARRRKLIADSFLIGFGNLDSHSETPPAPG